MRIQGMGAALIAAMMMLGCGASATTATTPTQTATFAALVEDAPAPTREPPEAGDAEAAIASFDLSGLPNAPWAEGRLGRDAAPATLLAAWSRAENREWCAPVYPRALGRGEGALARAGELEGGWSVEFDQRGRPGLDEDGETCARCGRAAFGVAGTTLGLSDLADPEGPAMTPSFADGSVASFEADEDETVAAATISVAGQGCVYQVWSFLGREHLDELVGALRVVDVGPETSEVASR